MTKFQHTTKQCFCLVNIGLSSALSRRKSPQEGRAYIPCPEKRATNVLYFLANVNSRSHSLHAIARPSVCQSVCHLSCVCL